MSQHHGNWIDLKSSFVLNRGMGSKSRTSWFQWSIPSNMWCHSVPLACQAAPRPYRQASLLALCDGPGILWVHRGGNWSQADANPQRRNIKPVFTGLSGTMAGHGGDCKWFMYLIDSYMDSCSISISLFSLQFHMPHAELQHFSTSIAVFHAANATRFKYRNTLFAPELTRD